MLSLKVPRLLAMVCGKRVGDLQALSTSTACLEFGRNDCMVRLTPRRGYVQSTSFRAQVITLQAFAPQKVASFMPCSRFASLCGHRKGLLVSKQHFSHWIVKAIALACF